MDFRLPFRVLKLSVLIDKRQILGGGHKAFRLRGALKAQVRNAQIGKPFHFIFIGPLHHEMDACNVPRIDCVGSARIWRGTVDLGMGQK